MASTRYQDTRARGRAILAERLGLEPDVRDLLAAADEVLGLSRAGRCISLVEHMKLTQRYHGLSAIAALVSGTRLLGEAWWSRPYQPPVAGSKTTPQSGTPDDRLRAAEPSDQRSWPATVVALGHWIADDAAVAAWGPLVDDVDLNDPRSVDRIKRLPSNAVVGQRITAHFDTGGVVDADVEERDGGALGTSLDIESSRYSDPAEVDWAWAVALPPPGPFPLPGEKPDPYSRAVDSTLAAELHDQGLGLGWSTDELGSPWQTRGDVCAALARLDWPWSDWSGNGKKRPWLRAIEELIDGADLG